MKSDFMSVAELSAATTFNRKSIYNMRSSGHGPLAGILSKVGGKLGCWREDFEIWKAAQRRLNALANEQRRAPQAPRR